MAHSIPSNEYFERQNRTSATLTVVSTWFGVVIILITAVGYTLSNPFDPSPTKPIVELMQFGLVALILASIICMVLRTEEGFGATAVPLFINIGTLMVIHLVPFGVLWEEVRFQTHFYQYQTVLQKVDSGELKPDVEGKVFLPTSFSHLSADDGRIWLNQGNGTSVFFVTEQYNQAQFAGYFRHVDGRPTQSGEFQGNWQAIVHKRGGWYYCISN